MARLVSVLNPDLVLLGGGLTAGATDLVLALARQALADATPLSTVVAAPRTSSPPAVPTRARWARPIFRI